MADAVFRFVYQPPDKSSELDSYDAAEALYGISRSISIITHYAINKRVIKQAPSLEGARVLVRPPAKGSFEFIIPIVQFITDPSNVATVAHSLESSLLYDITKHIYRRLAGKSEKTSISVEMEQLIRQKSGDIDALTDSISQDVIRIQRPIATDQSNNLTLNVYGGTVNIVGMNRDTYDYAKTKILGTTEDEFFGHVQSFNGSTNQGRFWMETEERTVGFSVHQHTKLRVPQRRFLSWSLDQWVRKLEGNLFLTGYPLSSKTGLLKHIFITSVKKA